MGENKEYKEMIDGFVEYQKNLHVKHQKKISVGLKVNILLPLVFLLLCFFSDGSKLIFLMLWIISLFGIAFYLVYVEFTDYKVVRKMKEFGMIDDEELENRKLIGDNIETAGDNLVERLDEIDEKIDANKKRIAETFQSGKERLTINVLEEKEKILEERERLLEERENMITRLRQRISQEESEKNAEEEENHEEHS